MNFDSLLDAASLQMVQLNLTYGKGQFAIVTINSDVASEDDASGILPGLYLAPLTFGVTDLESADMGTWENLLEPGQMAIYVDQISDSSQLFMDFSQGASSSTQGALIALYYGLTATFATDLTVQVQDDVDIPSGDYYGVVSIDYSSYETEHLRALFGQPEGSDTDSIIEDGIISMSTSIAAYQKGEIRFKTNAIKTKPFTGNELTLLTGEEAAQGVALSLETITGSAGVTSTTEYTTGGMY
jgi:hypothetical protein